jgi:ectoine hydroxylase-related dioxygenase (phytanoyl-CoA dioxygenase family)
MRAIDDVSARALRTCFEDQGYVVERGILSVDLIESLATLCAQEHGRLVDVFRTQTGVSLDERVEVDRFAAHLEEHPAELAALSVEARDILRGQFPQSVRTREEFLGLTRETLLVSLLAELLGSPRLRLHFPPMVRFKTPSQSHVNVPLHQDAPYFNHIDRFVNVWVPLCPITDACGGLDVLSGSHKLGAVAHQPSSIWQDGFVELDSLSGQGTPVHITMEPGDALLFGQHLLHRSHSNTSDHMRWSIDARWFTSATESRKQYYDLVTRQLVKVY